MKKCDCWIETQDNLVNVQTVTDAIILKGFSPYVGPNGNWFEYDEQLQQYIDTGVHAKGDRGEKGEKGDTYTITEADYIAIGDLVTDREESKFNQYVEGKKEEFNSNALAKTSEFNANAQSKTSTFDSNAVSKTNAFNTNASAKTTEFDTHATEKANEEIARINADEIVARIDEKADKSDTYTKTEVDEKVAQATPTDYDQVKEDIALLKWKTLNLATEVVDSQEAYSKSVPNNVYENALLNKIGGKTEVANQLVSTNRWTWTTPVKGIETIMDNGVISFIGTTNEVGEIVRFTNTYNAIKDHYIYYGVKGSEKVTIQTNVNGNYFNYANRIIKITSESALANVIPTIRGTYNQEVGTTFNEQAHLYIVDLSKRYGVGNEPTSIDDIRIKLLDQELEENGEYNEGSLVNASVESVVSKGKNLLPISTATQQTYYGLTFTNNNDGTYSIKGTASNTANFFLFDADNKMFLNAGNYTISCEGSSTDCYLIVNGANYGLGIPYKAIMGSPYSVTSSGDGYFDYVLCQVPNGKTIDVTLKPQIERGNNATPYTPYFESVKPIATIIEKYFPNKMKGFNGVYDEFDLEQGKAIQRVGYSTYNLISDIHQTDNNIFIVDLQIPHNNNAIMPIYTRTNVVGIASMVDKSYHARGTQNNYDGSLYLRDSSFNNYIQLREAIGNMPFYYELATPIVTDIDQEDLEYLEALKVESNGTITFEQLSTYIQIPNEESYLKRVE